MQKILARRELQRYRQQQVQPAPPLFPRPSLTMIVGFWPPVDLRRRIPDAGELVVGSETLSAQLWAAMVDETKKNQQRSLPKRNQMLQPHALGWRRLCAPCSRCPVLPPVGVAATTASLARRA